MKTRTLVLANILCGLLVASCANKLRTFHAKGMDFGSIQRVGVLPLANFSRDNSAAPRVRDAMTTMLLATEAFEVLPQGEVARAMMRTGVRSAEMLTSDKLKELGKLLKVDALFTGAVREYGELRSGQATANSISLSLQLYEVATGKTIWSAQTTQGGVTFVDRLVGGGGKPMATVTEKAIDVLIDSLFAAETAPKKQDDEEKGKDGEDAETQAMKRAMLEAKKRRDAEATSKRAQGAASTAGAGAKKEQN